MMCFILPYPWIWNLEENLNFNTLIEKDYGVTIELVSLVSNIKKKVSSVLDSFLSFMKKYEEK
jgi:hypothetical protein